MKINAVLLTIALLTIASFANANGSQVSVGSLAVDVHNTTAQANCRPGGGGGGYGGGHTGGGKPQCTPEPVSMVGLGMAALGVIRARAKKKA